MPGFDSHDVGFLIQLYFVERVAPRHYGAGRKQVRIERQGGGHPEWGEGKCVFCHVNALAIVRESISLFRKLVRVDFYFIWHRVWWLF